MASDVIRGTIEDIAFAITDLRGRFIGTDQKYCEITGYDAGTLQQMSILDLTFARDVDRNRVLLGTLVEAGRPFTIRKRYVRRNDSMVWVENAVSRLQGLSGPQLVAACRILCEEVDLEHLQQRCARSVAEAARMARAFRADIRGFQKDAIRRRDRMGGGESAK